MGTTIWARFGSNLGDERPSIAEFYQVLKTIRSRSDVQDVLARIYGYDDPES